MSFSQLTFINNKPIVKACFDIFFDPNTNKIFNIFLRKNVKTPLVYIPICYLNSIDYIVNNFILSLSMLLDKQLPYTKDCYFFNNPISMNINAFYAKILEFLVTNIFLIKYSFFFSYTGQDFTLIKFSK